MNIAGALQKRLHPILYYLFALPRLESRLPDRLFPDADSTKTHKVATVIPSGLDELRSLSIV